MPDSLAPEVGAASWPGTQLNIILPNHALSETTALRLVLLRKRQDPLVRRLDTRRVSQAGGVSSHHSTWPRPATNRVEFDHQCSLEMRNSCPLNLSVTRMVSPARVKLLYEGTLKATTRPLESRSTRRPKRSALKPQDEVFSKDKPDRAHCGPRAGEIRSDIGCIRQQDRPKQHPA
jgi:hypothetical protein